MSEKYNISTLFDQSGNLTLNAIERFLRDELNPAERVLVEKHFSESDFDREALEGLKKHSSTNFSREIGDLQRNILVLAKKRKMTGNFRIFGKSYWYAAAGLAGLIGLSVLLFFMFREPAAELQLAVMQPDTIIDKTTAAVGQMENAPILEKVMVREEKPQKVITSPIKTEPEHSPAIAEITSKSLEEVAMQEPAETARPVIVAEDAAVEDAAKSREEFQVVGDMAVSNNNDYEEKKIKSEGRAVSKNYELQSKGAVSIEDDEIIADPYPGDPDTLEPFLVVEKMPEFPGGEYALYKFIEDSIQYPQLAIENKIQGKVYVQFVVKENGSITDVRVLRGIGGGCDEEAIRVIKSMPKWTPGKHRGKPVTVNYTLPIKFTLEKSGNSKTGTH